jgi:hypothetical protein
MPFDSKIPFNTLTCYAFSVRFAWATGCCTGRQNPTNRGVHRGLERRRLPKWGILLPNPDRCVDGSKEDAVVEMSAEESCSFTIRVRERRALLCQVPKAVKLCKPHSEESA